MIVRRNNNSTKQITSHMLVFEQENLMYHCYALELVWKNNYRRISCIPAGIYNVDKRHTDKYGDHFYVTDVPNRDFILIHAGNYHTDIQGCILPGLLLQDINHDGELDTASSRAAMQDLLGIMPTTFKLKIVEFFD